MEDNVHEGHRQRVRDEFLINGFNENTPKHKILEMILFYCIKQKDTNELAHRMLQRYKTLTGVLNAPVKELVEFPGITENTAVYLKLILPVARICAAENQKKVSDFNSLDAAGKYISEKFLGIQEEKTAILLLDGVGRKLDFRFISDGDVSAVGISVRKIVQACIETGAVAVILAHNHPSGIALPSEQDLAVTEMLFNALKGVDIHLIDHIIVVRDDFVSLAQSVKYAEIFNKNSSQTF